MTASAMAENVPVPGQQARIAAARTSGNVSLSGHSDEAAALSNAALMALLRRLYAQQARAVPSPNRGTLGQRATLKRPKAHDLPTSLGTLPPGQRRVAEALVGGAAAPTYDQVAAALGLHVGTVLGYLNRIRERRPEVYAELRELRRRQLADRHRSALRRAAEHSRRWHRRQANRRYYYRFGRWPWERSR